MEKTILSLDKQNYLVRLITTSLKEKKWVEYNDFKRVQLRVRGVLTQCIKIIEEIDQKIVQKIHGLKRNVVEQSPEWKVLYSKYLEEEMIRRGLIITQQK